MLQQSMILIRQNLSDGSLIETGIPVGASNIKRWIYELREERGEEYLTIDIGMSRSIKLNGRDASETRDFIVATYDRIHEVEK